MIRKFIDKLLGKASPNQGKSARTPVGKRVEIAAPEHGINPDLLDDRAVKVVRTLQEAGYSAYIVGGAVRDLLVARRPKDFDVATDATPEQVKSLFRRAFIIGRRFRLVHVVFGRGRDHEVIEVSTYRAYVESDQAASATGTDKPSKSELAGKSHAVDAAGRVLRDNVWGSQIEDAARRDFTVNAMYYDPTTQVVVDYHGGIKDIKKRALRMIGDPVTRYREDPVRIIRAVRFAAKLGFDIESASRAPIRELASLLDSVPSSRLFDELFKLLQTGHSLASVAELRKQGLHGRFPLLEPLMAEGIKHKNQRVQFIEAALADTDTRIEQDKGVAPSFLLACLLWHEVRERWQGARQRGVPAAPALQEAIDAVFDARVGDISGRGKLGTDMREIWLMQPRFERRTGTTPYAIIEQPRFRAAYDFLRLRADTGEADEELADWWEDFSLGTAEEREALIASARESMRSQTRGGNEARQRREAGDSESPDDAADTEAGHGQGAGAEAAPAKKRRRRRRKPGGGAGVPPSGDAG